VQVALLGPLLVTAAGEAVAVGAAKERAVLAVLALRGARGARIEELTAALWGDNAPRSAHKTVQTYVSALRRVLPDGVIETVPWGYRLCLPAEDVDVAVFERLVNAGRRASEQGDLRGAVSFLVEALGLWRGDPLVELADRPLGRAEAVRLVEVRRTAEEDLAQGRLDLGGHAALISDLESGVAAEPLRERRWAQLMLALYRSGRQADALRAYQRLRSTLSEELGIDPSAELVALEEAILLQKPDLAWMPPPGALSVGARGDGPVGMPAGTVTFLFTDIEGSTNLLRRLGLDYATLLNRHRQMIRAAAADHGGVEVGTEGDGLFFVFAGATHALSAAVAAQHALQQARWPLDVQLRVRMGLHTGEATRVGDDYVGLAVHQAARIAAAAHGGQILISELTATAADIPLERATVRDLGRFRLKDFDNAVRLFQVEPDGRSTLFPPPRAAPAAGGRNLPAAVTGFVGRATEVAQVSELLSASRLVTLTGVGGGGKTRLAIQVATGMAERFGDGAWFVDLAPLGDGQLVADAVARALGLSDLGKREPAAVVEDYLRDRELLLVVDNCEHLVEPAAGLTRRLLEAAAGLKVLATSRRHLAIAGEVRYSVPPMAVADALQLFVDRLAAVRPGLHLGQDDLAVVAAICRKVDGIPLALELAAARAGVLSLAEVAAKLDDALAVLANRGAGGPARHQTLEAAIDWGYRLLSPAGQTMLGRLSVLAGDWSLAAAEAVYGPKVAEGVLDLIDELVGSSFVQADVAGPAARYRLLEPIRQYAAAKLRSTGDETQARDRHLAWYLALAEQFEHRTFGRDPAAALDQVESDIDNLRAALAWSIQAQSADIGERLVNAVYPFFFIRANYREGLTWSRQVLTLPGPPTGTRSAVSRRAGILALSIGDLLGAGRHFAQAVADGQASGDRRHLGRALCSISFLSLATGELDLARSQLEEAIALATETGDAVFEAEGRIFLARLACHQGHLAEARALAIAVIDQGARDDWIHREGALFVLADVAHVEGQYRLAEGYASEGLALHAPLGGRNIRLTRVGLMAMAQGQLADARAAFNAAAAAEASISDEPYIPLIAARGSFAVIDGDTTGGLGRLDHALQLARQRADVLELMAVLVLHGEAHLRAGDAASGHGSLQEAVAAAYHSGMKRDLPGAMEALAACVVAEQSVASATQAARLLGAAEALRADMGAVPAPDRHWIRQAALSGAVDVLGPDQATAIRSSASQAGLDAVLGELSDLRVRRRGAPRQ
jgi:predicted ATPase/DNA-binding SARP family transcriptional activator/class 3 adenylate cyclase